MYKISINNTLFMVNSGHTTSNTSCTNEGKLLLIKTVAWPSYTVHSISNFGNNLGSNRFVEIAQLREKGGVVLKPKTSTTYLAKSDE
jgi:hypothetical protein